MTGTLRVTPEKLNPMQYFHRTGFYRFRRDGSKPHGKYDQHGRQPEQHLGRRSRYGILSESAWPSGQHQ